MKKFIYLLFAGCISLFMMSCEGPAGKDGADGAPGEPGQNMDATCLVCHNSTTSSLNAIMDQFEESAHAIGTYYDRDGQCAACHNTEGFLARADYSSISEIDNFTGAKSALSCYTCHNIHQDYALSDFALTNASQVTETILGYSSPDITSTSLPDMGSANICLQCHQSRDRGNVPSPSSTGTVEITSSHWGPHYGVQGNLFSGMGGVDVGTGYPASNAHTGQNTTCITCHMPDNNHNLHVDFDNCASCHTAGDAEDKFDALHTEIHDQLFALGALLESQGVMAASYEADGVTVAGYSPVGSRSNPNVISVEQASAMWNYMVIYQDHSYGLHNPGYAKKLLENSIAAVTP